MKYFTAELLNRFRSLDDDVADRAAEEWEAAIAAYRQRLEEIGPQLPFGAARLLKRHTLHDAEVAGMLHDPRRATLEMQLRLPGKALAPDELLELKYRLASGLVPGIEVEQRLLIGEKGGAPAFVLYNEFDIAEGGAYFVHSLLLSSGAEFTVRFREMSARIVEDGRSKYLRQGRGAEAALLGS